MESLANRGSLRVTSGQRSGKFGFRARASAAAVRRKRRTCCRDRESPFFPPLFLRLRSPLFLPLSLSTGHLTSDAKLNERNPKLETNNTTQQPRPPLRLCLCRRRRPPGARLGRRPRAPRPPRTSRRSSARTSATSPSSRTSTTARPRWSTRCSGSPRCSATTRRCRRG